MVRDGIALPPMLRCGGATEHESMRLHVSDMFS
jgi:hypothetical protein